jgi:pimeloyl-ACP methyl ester carboxylesterase
MYISAPCPLQAAVYCPYHARSMLLDEAVVCGQVGRGPGLVLLHGFGSGLAAWAPVLAPLAARYTVYALDLPGHGRSARPPFPAANTTPAGGGDGAGDSGWWGAAGLWLDGPRLAPAYPAAVAADAAAAEEYFVGPLEGWRAEMCAQVQNR